MVDHHLDPAKKNRAGMSWRYLSLQTQMDSCQVLGATVILAVSFGGLWNFEGRGLRNIKAPFNAKSKGLRNIRPPTFLKVLE